MTCSVVVSPILPQYAQRLSSTAVSPHGRPHPQSAGQLDPDGSKVGTTARFAMIVRDPVAAYVNGSRWRTASGIPAARRTASTISEV